MKRPFLPIAFLLTVLLITWIPGALASKTYTETFEDDHPPATPTAAFYTWSDSGSGGTSRTSSAKALGSVSYLVDNTGVAGVGVDSFFDYGTVGVDFCNSGQIKFALNIATMPVAGKLALFQFGGTFAMQLQDTGAVRLVSGANTGSDFATLSTNTWYNVTLSIVQNSGSCAAGAATFRMTAYILEIDAASTLTSSSQTCPCTFPRIEFAGSGTGNHDKFYIDNLAAVNVQDPPPTSVSSDATSSTFTNLVGFSVDRTSSLAIVRTDSGDFIRTLSSVDLSTQASEDTDCTRNDNVLSQYTPSGPLVLYTDCDGSGNPDTFKIRTSALNAPELSGCGAGCADLDSNTFVSNADDDQTQFSQVEQFPIDFNVHHEAFNVNTYKLAWAWSGQGSRAGEVGIATYTDCTEAIGCPDYAELSRVTFGGTSSAVADDMCTSIDTGGHFWMASADATAPGKTYPVTWTNISDPINTNHDDLRAVIGSAATFPVSGPIAVACGHSRVAFNTASQVSVWPESGGAAPLWTASCTCKTRGVTLSNIRPDGMQFVAWLDGNTGYIAYANNGTKIGSVAYTQSGFTEVKMQEYAQSLYIASNNVVKRFAINSVTGVVSSGGTEISATPSNGAFFAGSGALVGASLGIGSFGGNLFLGIVCMGICAVGVGTALSGRIIGFLIGGIAGFCFAWAFGFFSTAVVFTLVVLGLLAFFFLNKRGASS